MTASDNVSSTQFPYAVHTQHGEERKHRVVRFPDYDSALEHAKKNDPDTDGSMVPNVDESFNDHPGYEKGLYWLRNNNYAVIIDERRTERPNI